MDCACFRVPSEATDKKLKEALMDALYSRVCAPLLGGMGPLAEGSPAKSKCTHDRVIQTLSVFIWGGGGTCLLGCEGLWSGENLFLAPGAAGVGPWRV